jgi:hypothetical protein
MREVQKLFRFRFISRGKTANHLTQLAVKALQWCHPGVRVTVIDANDEPQLSSEEFPGVDLLHVIPRNDSVAERLGRGSRKHLFYWRHSPEVLAVVPRDTEFTAYMDSDILLMRPMDLSSLIDPLRQGRIAVLVDESMLVYIDQLRERAYTMSPVLNVPGTGGPLLQGGLIFSHVEDDGNLYQEFWRLAEIAAAEDILNLLPFDDMALLTALLTQGGKLWKRWLPLGYEWNYITAADQDPGVFAVGAHYGGFRAKALVLDSSNRFTVPNTLEHAWGSTSSGCMNGQRRFLRGVISGLPKDGFVHYRLAPPFAISWIAQHDTQSVTIEAQVQYGCLGSMLVHIDGRYRFCLKNEGLTRICHEFSLDGGRVITVIAVPNTQADVEVIDFRRNFFHENIGTPLASQP